VCTSGRKEGEREEYERKIEEREGRERVREGDEEIE
jgi:hypothetical protein